ncbi:MAG TPA: DUF4350 domain-containing protein [Mucilaginibacter sp.]|nr:DUF4350 domain-containing protein [Mucilaginibacter sp.]
MKNILSTCALLILTGLFFTASAQVVTLDYYFNHETHKNKPGQEVRFHYMWEDTEMSGFSILGETFKRQGAKLQSLEDGPTRANLKGANIYIIVDPDTEKETAHPNYIEEKDIKEIEKWVKAGGVLVMLANDSANVELPHFNNLAAKFGMHFNDDLQNHVVDDHFSDGTVFITNNPIFKTAQKIYMKDVCSIDIKSPAYVGLRNSNNAVIIAIAKYGKGTVFAVGDPWLYNEYTNGKLPAGYENDKAAEDITRWLIKQIP